MSRQKATLSAIASAIVFTGAVAAGPASADFIFSLDTGNPAISGFTGPYATVDVHLTDSTHATISFTALDPAGSNDYMMGAAGAVGFNVNGAAAISLISGTNDGLGFTPGTWSDGGAGNEDGFGSFNHTIDSFDSYGHASDFITFTLTKSSGTWSSDTNVLTANSGGSLAAAHIIVSPGEDFSSAGALATGYAAGSGTPTPPHFDIVEPHAVGLFGLVVLGLGFGCTHLSSVRRRRAQPQPA